MSGFIQEHVRIARPLGWIDQFERLLARELAPSPRKFRTAVRIATIATVAVALTATCHVNGEYGVYFVWLLAGAGPMMSARRALLFLIAEAIALCASVVMALTLVETPWLLLPFLFLAFTLSTYFGTIWKLGVSLVLIEVVCLSTFYGAIFEPDNIGWNAAGSFGSCVIAFGVLALFDNWLWPDPSERTLMESLGNSIARGRVRLLGASAHYLDRQSAARPPLPPPTSDLPEHTALLDQATVEGLSQRRHAILLAAITRVARINLEIDRLIIAARERVPGEIRAMLRPEIQETVEALAGELGALAAELPKHIAIGTEQRPADWRIRARAAMNALSARLLQVRPLYLGRVSPAEIENMASFLDSLGSLTRRVEHLPDEPVELASAVVPVVAVRHPILAPDPAVARFSVRVGLCVVTGFTVGAISQRPDLFSILITVLVTALPTYGAALYKVSLRMAGTLVGGAIALLAIMIVSPSFDTLPTYMMTFFLVFAIAAYCSMATGRIAYAARQAGVTFAIAFAGLAAPNDIYEPLWRTWGVLLGTVVVGVLSAVLWPVYAGDSLLPRLRRVIGNTLALAPSGHAANSEVEIQRVDADAMQILNEILEVAVDAQVEGRGCTVNSNAIVEAAGILRRIASRLASIASARIAVTIPRLDPEDRKRRVTNFSRRSVDNSSPGSTSSPARIVLTRTKPR